MTTERKPPAPQPDPTDEPQVLSRATLTELRGGTEVEEPLDETAARRRPVLIVKK